MPVGSYDESLIAATFEVPVLGSSGWKIFGTALSCFSPGRCAENSGGQKILPQCAKWGCSAGLEYTGSRWLARNYFSSIFKQSFICFIRVINLLTECKLWGHCPNMSILELWNIFFSDMIFSNYFCQKNKHCGYCYSKRTQNSIFL